MEKQMLRCDICGGELEMQGGGKAVCASCGMRYSTESLRDKFNGLKVSVTGSREDVEQWKTLAMTYIDNFDYTAADQTVNRILEAVPNDCFASDLYLKLREWKHYKVSDGILVECDIPLKTVNIPSGIKKIGDGVFARKSADVYCEQVNIHDGVEHIGSRAFYGQSHMKNIVIPSSVKIIGREAFYGCNALQEIVLPSSLKMIGPDALYGVPRSKVHYDGTWNLESAFNSEVILVRNRQIVQEARDKRIQLEIEKKREGWRKKNLCQYCGGVFKGLFTKACSGCGKTKDY